MILVLSALLFSISSNLDNLVIGIAYGIKKIRIELFSNLLIAIITTLGTLISMTVGKFIADFLPPSITNMLGALIILILGLYFFIESIYKLITSKRSKKLALKNSREAIEYAETSDLDNSGSLNLKEAFLVSMGLMINNLGTGLAASITGVSIKLTVLFTFLISPILLMLGRAIGCNIFGKICGKYAPLLSGILLIILSIIECLN